MPMVDGKPVRARFTALKLGELSSVDKPAQPGATAVILKRDESQPAPEPAQKAAPSVLALAVAKYVETDAGAHTFDEVLQANVFDEKIWPMVSALSQSIRSIMADTKVKGADKEAKVTQSVDEFLAAVRDISPTAEKRLAELVSKRNPNMPRRRLRPSRPRTARRRRRSRPRPTKCSTSTERRFARARWVTPISPSTRLCSTAPKWPS